MDVEDVVSPDAGIAGPSRIPNDDLLNFEGWYRSEHERLMRVMVRLGVGPDDAADLADEAFSRALARWERVSVMDSPTGWVYQVALNLLRRSQRRKRLERRLLARRAAAPMIEPVPVWDAVARLPLRQRTAVVLPYLVDLPQRDVASVMGVKEGTVAATLASARRALGRALDDREDDR